MANEDIPKLVRCIYESDGFQEITADLLDKQLETVIEDAHIPVFDYFVKLKNMIGSVNDYFLYKKVIRLTFCLKDTTPQERYKAIGEIEAMNREEFGITLSSILDKLDNRNKVDILCNLLKSKIHEEITTEDFLRLSFVLENVPFVDLYKLPLYTEDRYQAGESELLSGVGLITVHRLDMNTSIKYLLNEAGFKLVKYGLKIDLPDLGNPSLTSTNFEWRES